jgi:CheY-like chemotaxis protein
MRVRVFVFDDEPMVRRVFATIARRSGYDVEVFNRAAPCGAAASSCFCGPGEWCADAVITDFNMPDMTGLDLVEHLRARGCRCPRIAMISGFLSPDVADRASALGVTLFSKPVSWAEVEGWLAACRAAAPPARRLADHYPNGPAGAFREPPPPQE